MGHREAVRLVARLLSRETGVSALAAEHVIRRAVRSAGLAERRYFDDLDLESLLFQVSLESDRLARAAVRILLARAA